jgi:hypothetical protein
MDIMSAFFYVVLSSVGTGLAIGRSPTLGILPTYLNGFIVLEVNSEPEQAGRLNPLNVHCTTTFLVTDVLYYLHHTLQ